MSDSSKQEVYAHRLERMENIANRQHPNKHVAVNNRQVTEPVAAREINATRDEIAPLDK